MLTSSSLPPLPQNDYRPTNHAALLSTPLPMVWTPETPDLRQRPPLYIALQVGISKRTWDHLEFVHSLSPLN